jgi:hypothetical protein
MESSGSYGLYEVEDIFNQTALGAGMQNVQDEIKNSVR